MKYVCCVIWRLHIQIHTLLAVGPHQKKEIIRFRNGLVRELKVNKRELLRQSKTLCSNRRNLFLESEDYKSYMEKSLAREMCIKFKREEISTTGEDCSRSNSKEKEVRSFALRVDQPIECQQEEEKRGFRRFVNVVIGIIIIDLLLVCLEK